MLCLLFVKGFLLLSMLLLWPVVVVVAGCQNVKLSALEHVAHSFLLTLRKHKAQDLKHIPLIGPRVKCKHKACDQSHVPPPPPLLPHTPQTPAKKQSQPVC